MSGIHVICHQQGDSYRGLEPLDADRSRYLSHSWLIRDGNPMDLLGGKIYFHESRKLPATLSATIVDVSPWPASKNRSRVAFEIEVLPEVGQSWRGSTPSPTRPHGGIVTDEPEDELIVRSTEIKK
jgi:hypothetical protein